MTVRYTVPSYVSEVTADEAAPLNPYAGGYGSKIPTRYRVRYLNRWRRVWVTQFSNVGSAWISVSGKQLFLDTDTEYKLAAVR
jgi:hypothetical protein